MTQQTRVRSLKETQTLTTLALSLLELLPRLLRDWALLLLRRLSDVVNCEIGGESLINPLLSSNAVCINEVVTIIIIIIIRKFITRTWSQALSMNWRHWQ